ncbi:MAG: hypothetical protein MAG794_01809 [Gammaproteobacteria bacterium]|nr:hypothetical protein [Gammaproteobacteria bacterium]
MKRGSTHYWRVMILLDIVGKQARAKVNIEHLGPAD